jgi:hypothetical protein
MSLNGPILKPVDSISESIFARSITLLLPIEGFNIKRPCYRFTINPGESLQITGVLFICFASSMMILIVCSFVRLFSSLHQFHDCGRIKKCIPITRSGFFTPLAICVMERDEVLLAKTVSL